jgi:GT2 family glycosyltransferase
MGEPVSPIWIILPVHNRRAVTHRFVDSLLAQTDSDFRVVLVDDGSIDGTADMVTARLPGTVVVKGTGNWWWARSLQAGVEWLSEHRLPANSIVMTANDDTTFEPNFLGNARAVISERHRTLLLPRLMDRATGRVSELGANVDFRTLEVRPAMQPESVNCFSTRGLFLRLADFKAIGGFRPVLLPHYLSDYEFTMRAASRGFTLLTDPTVSLYFDETQTGERGDIKARPAVFLRRTFSRRNAGNPVAWTMFILMRSPVRFVPMNLLRVWSRFVQAFASTFKPMTS